MPSLKLQRINEVAKNLARKLSVALIPAWINVPIIAGPATGFRVTRDMALTHPSILIGHYERAVTKAILSIDRSIQVAYDIGAHVGLTTLILAKGFGHEVKVIAFEPSRENVLSLEALIVANPGINVTLVPVALSERNGEAKFYRFQAATVGMLDAVAIGDHYQLKECEYDLVRTVTLDAFVFDEGHPPPEFIKIDVEGAEDLVVAGGLRTIERYRPILLIELHGPKHAAEVWDLLLKQRYQWNYIDPKLGPTKAIADRSQLLAYFGSGDRWTQHVILR